MEIPETKFEELLVARHYLIVCYREGLPCSYQMYDGGAIGNNREYFVDGEDAQGKALTYKFFLLPKMVR